MNKFNDPMVQKLAASMIMIDVMKHEREGNVLYPIMLTPLALAILTDTMDELIAKLSEYMDAHREETNEGDNAYKKWVDNAGK